MSTSRKCSGPAAGSGTTLVGIVPASASSAGAWSSGSVGPEATCAIRESSARKPVMSQVPAGWASTRGPYRIAYHGEPSGSSSTRVCIGSAISTRSPSRHVRRTETYEDGAVVTGTGSPLTLTVKAPGATQPGCLRWSTKRRGWPSLSVSRVRGSSGNAVSCRKVRPSGASFSSEAMKRLT